MYEGEPFIDLPGLDETIEAAKEAQACGVNHREYLVGAAAQVVTDCGLRIIQGANFKPLPGDEGPRVCAELDTVHAAFKSPLQGLPRVRRFRHLVVYAEPQADDQTGKDYRVLVPCFTCRPYLWDLMMHGIYIGPEMPFISVNAETGERRMFRMEKLLRDCGCGKRSSHTPRAPLGLPRFMEHRLH